MEHGRRRARRGRLLAAGEGNGRGGGLGRGVVTDIYDCGARGEGGTRWLDMKETAAHTEAGDIPALRVRDSTAAAASWLVMARYSNSDSRDIPKTYARGGLVYMYIYIHIYTHT